MVRAPFDTRRQMLKKMIAGGQPTANEVENIARNVKQVCVHLFFCLNEEKMIVLCRFQIIRHHAIHTLVGDIRHFAGRHHQHAQPICVVLHNLDKGGGLDVSATCLDLWCVIPLAQPLCDLGCIGTGAHQM